MAVGVYKLFATPSHKGLSYLGFYHGAWVYHRRCKPGILEMRVYEVSISMATGLSLTIMYKLAILWATSVLVLRPV